MIWPIPNIRLQPHKTRDGFKVFRIPIMPNDDLAVFRHAEVKFKRVCTFSKRARKRSYCVLDFFRWNTTMADDKKISSKKLGIRFWRPREYFVPPFSHVCDTSSNRR